jgi:predicted nucleic acid-binding protein
VIADATPFIHLERIGLVHLLPEVFGTVIVPKTVAREVAAGHSRQSSGLDLRSMPWVTVEPDASSPVVLAEPGLHPGEIAALSLALAIPDHLLVIDDRAGREAALHLGLRFIGTAGTIIKARKHGLIPSAAVVFDQLDATGFRLATAIRRVLLAQVAES